MPFNVIYIPFSFKGLCPPGLGTGHYVEISLAFIELLPCLLPVGSILPVSAIVDAVSMESNNDYNLLFHVMVLAIPGFGPTLPLSAPIWAFSMDLFEFCRSHHFYFWIQGKKGIFFDYPTKSGIFLRAIGTSEYADVTTTLQSHINLFHGEFNGGLPYHPCINGLAEAIHNYSIACLGFNAPAYCATEDIARPIQDSLAASWAIDLQRQGHPNADPGCHCGGNLTERDFPQDVLDCSSPTLLSWGHVPNPGQHQCKFLPGVTCAACWQISHQAVNFDMLAMALCLKRNMKGHLSNATHDSIKLDWVNQWKDCLDNPRCKSQQGYEGIIG
jgi:hypothetical protein